MGRTIEMTCDKCGKLFHCEYKHRNERKYCSFKCSRVARKKPVNECLVCGKPTTSHINLTCSRACSNTYFRSGENHPNWKDQPERSDSRRPYRNICLANYEKKCIICGYDRVIDVHHIDGNKKNNSPENLVPLCRNHHAEIHTLEWGEETKGLLSERLNRAV